MSALYGIENLLELVDSEWMGDVHGELCSAARKFK